jgi:CRISPR-associated protein Cst2
MNKNLFATVLTYPAPSSNYRGDGEENRVVLQRIAKGSKEYTVISAESIRNALREMLIKFGQPCNRTRLKDYIGDDGKPQLAVEFKEFPNPEKYADDFLFGFMVADKEAVKKHKISKRDSVFRANLALALSQYRFDDTFHQSPFQAKTKQNEKTYWKNADKSILFNRERCHTAYQYPFALNFQDCLHLKNGDRWDYFNKGAEWTKALIKAISELTDVAGGHARSYYEMAPKSIVARLTPNLVAGYDTYGFNENGEFPELTRIKASDLPGDEFWIGGEIVRSLSLEQQEYLENEGVHLYENPQKLLADIADEFLLLEAK